MSKSTRNKKPQDSENLNGLRPDEQRGCRSREDRGLPDEAARRDLARTYLELQNQYWIKVPAVRQHLPAATEENVDRLAEEFKQGFLCKKMDPPMGNISRSAGVSDIGGAYLRYSCENSNPRSLDQQLRNTLERASRDHVFIPWGLVFADAAVTGTTAARRGYQMAKAEIIRPSSTLQRLYIDEIGRAARGAIEALTLGRLIDEHRKQLIGVSDGFDSAQPHSG